VANSLGSSNTFKQRVSAWLALAVIGSLTGAGAAAATDEAPCLLTGPAGACMDNRLSGRADALVVTIDDDQQDQPPQWVVRFVVNGMTVQGRIPDWPAPDAPSVGYTARVAYDPASPDLRVTSTGALVDYTTRAAKQRSRDLATRFAAFVKTFAGFLALFLGVGVIVIAITQQRQRPPSPESSADRPQA
jgi:hypothetical protein